MKTAIPPIDTEDNLSKANKSRKACAKSIKNLPAEWQLWVVSSLQAQFAKDAAATIKSNMEQAE